MIENKLESKQTDGQLKKYINYIKEAFPEYKVLPIFWTLNYESPNGDYYVYSYDKFYKLLKDFSSSRLKMIKFVILSMTIKSLSKD
ncbi:hypothetical protein COD05_06130 [Bacillus cereus]|uniref:PD-(D/E)XK nuclease family protein n=1 Tax=Bacillus sp. AW TaxID=2293329 RepID=UPI000BF6FE19|nr:hypothetical protein COJ53_07060 [Bacillus cereus]PGP32384.1 hypothetical protein CN989_28115 [Bacillus cereus]PGT11577.1 hypothetical protein COD05_06130 [Bacillus cereus]RFB76203.1 hypothetical protein DZB94_08905 [Bacillus sp. AW]